MKRLRANGRSGFTLIELLTVVAVILILVGLIMTAVYSAQEAGRITSCRNNLTQLHKLILQYTTTYGNYLPAFWHERWVGQLGLVGKQWGDKKDDINPNVPPVWNNLSPTQNWLKNYNIQEDREEDYGYTGGHAYNGERRNIHRTGAPILTCPSDASKYRCDQGCDVSYMGLAKYGWWHRGNLTATNAYFSAHQLQEFDNFSNRLMLAESEPGTWQLGGCGCRWHAYRHPIKLLQRHYDGGNALMFDGHIELCKGNRSREVRWFDKDDETWLEGTYTDNFIRYWEPDYDQTDPGW
jgi:prepilin-type N-terminal cleavage/methylation domain-containing protein/prepilin-type processing-associated H-X9-DG protein